MDPHSPRFFLQVVIVIHDMIWGWAEKSIHGEKTYPLYAIRSLTMGYPLVNYEFATENGPFIIDLPIKQCNFPQLC